MRQKRPDAQDFLPLDNLNHGLLHSADPPPHFSASVHSKST